MQQLLIVDDDPSLLKSLCIVFEGRYAVETVTTAESALAMIERHPPDAMLLDIVLPGIDGLELLKTIRQTHVRLPVVMISGTTGIRVVLQAFELGASDFVRKPFNIEELRLRMARAVHNAATKAELDALKQVRSDAGSPSALRDTDGGTLKNAVERFERSLIERALADNDHVQTRAAEALGTTRRILQYRIQKLGITVNSR